MNCELIETPRGDGSSDYYCPRCKRTDRLPSGFSKANRTCGAVKSEPQGLGDRAEKLLSTFGITQSRYKEAKAWLLGKMPEEVTCECDARRLWLNQIGSEIKRLFG